MKNKENDDNDESMANNNNNQIDHKVSNNEFADNLQFEIDNSQIVPAKNPNNNNEEMYARLIFMH